MSNLRAEALNNLKDAISLRDNELSEVASDALIQHSIALSLMRIADALEVSSELDVREGGVRT
jgi:hypothetical protein